MDRPVSRRQPAGREQERPPRVLVLTQFFLPASNAGGPVRTLANLLERLGGEVDFKVVCGDRDLGATSPLPGVPLDAWTRRDGWSCLYLGRGAGRLVSMVRTLRGEPQDLVYVNSLFSRWFSIVPLLLRRLGVVPRTPMIVAPRGELNPGALGLNPRRKRAFLRLARAAGLYRGVTWQASSPHEAAEIRAWFQPATPVRVAPNLVSDTLRAERTGTKQPGRLRLAFLSRIAPKKNLAGALELLMEVPGEITFDMHGPIEDARYWERCRTLIARLPGNVRARHIGPVPLGSAVDVLAGYDAMLLPTLGENFGHAIVESLLAGCPVIVSDTTPWRGLEARGAGWDLPLGEPERFRAVLSRCVGMDAGEHGRWSSAARAYGVEVATDPAVLEANRSLFGLAPRAQTLTRS